MISCAQLLGYLLHSHETDSLFVIVIVTAQLGSLTDRVISGQSDSAFASEGGQQRDTVDQLEMHFYEIQLELYDAKFEILKHEEQLLVAQIDSLRRQIRGGLDPVGSPQAERTGLWLVYMKKLPT